MTDINELTANAESTIGILENIAGYEPGDIDGDTVELRFEDETGCDTGCNVSIVDLCQNAADVIRALTEALEAAESRIAELEARTLTVSQGDVIDVAEGKSYAPGRMIPIDTLADYCADAGIKLQVEGE